MSFGTFVRGWLARHGYLVTRIEQQVAPSVSEYLRAIVSEQASVPSIVCFDNDATIQSEILTVVQEDKVLFSSPILVRDSNELMLGTALPSPPQGRFLGVIDLESFSLDLLVSNLDWLRRSEVLLLRAQLGSFWTGKIDLVSLVALMDRIGFHLADVIGSSRLSRLQAGAERTVLAWKPGKGERKKTPVSRFRANEALAFLSAPIVQRGDFKLLAGRGSFGFAAGACNPGATVEAGRTYLLPRGERTPWAYQKTDESRFFSSPCPLLLTLGPGNQIATANEISIDGLPNASATRVEDFRLFRYRDQVFTNHSVMSDPFGGLPRHRRLRIERLQTRVGISRLDLEKRSLTWCGFAAIDRPLTRIEKNWAIFGDDKLLLLYSFSPYILLSSVNWPKLDFTPVLKAEVQFPTDHDGLSARNSINPITYDDNHWLHIVHRVYPGKQYSFWAVLIDKNSMLPVRVTARPLICGWASSSASIVYACSVTVDPVNVNVFAGLDDSATAVATIRRTRLDSEWVPLVSKAKEIFS
jgi:hypothetical protein